MTTALLNNRYQILQTLARGGFGETFLAIDTHMPSARKCVIKQLKPIIQSPSIPPWLKERFQREAAILEDLGEKNEQIPRLYAYFAEDGDFFLVQEWIEGFTLTQKHLHQGNFSSEQVKDILIKILPVLDYIHSRRIIHRDVKPDNIIIRASDGLPVLIDFGVMKEAMATAIHPDGMSAYSVALGTPGYMASEQAAGRPVFSSDLYSLGLTAVFLLTGKTPQYLETDPRSGEILWRNVVPDLHSNLATVIDRAIRFHPRDRFSTAALMLAALEAPPESQTAATLAVAPGNLKAQRVLTHKTPPPILESESEATPNHVELAEEPENRFNWLVPSLVIGGLMIGAFLFGFSAFIAQQRSRIVPSPSPSLESPEPIISPTPSPQEPEVSQPRRRPVIQPTPERTFAPIPEQELTPTPQETPLETGETPANPEGEISPSPEGETPANPETAPSPEATTSPSPEATTAPSPEATTSPVPSETPISSPTVQPSPNAPQNSNPPSPQPSPSSTPQQQKSSSPDHQSRILKVPVIATGGKYATIRQLLGEPTSVNKGLWGNSRAVLYKNVIPQVDVGFLFDPQTGRVKQTEISFAQSAGLGTMKTTLNYLLSGKAPPSVRQALEQVYQRKSNQYSFLVGNLKGTIQRNQSDRIYIGIWEADFH